MISEKASEQKLRKCFISYQVNSYFFSSSPSSIIIITSSVLHSLTVQDGYRDSRVSVNHLNSFDSTLCAHRRIKPNHQNSPHQRIQLLIHALVVQVAVCVCVCV